MNYLDDKEPDYNALRKLVAAIQLPGWTYQKPRMMDGRPADRDLGDLVNPEIQGHLDISASFSDYDKIQVRAEYPNDRQGQTGAMYNATRPSINVAVTKTAAQIAKDIERRLLPDYLPQLATAVERIRERHEYLDAKANMGAAIKSAFPQLELNDTINGEDERGNKRNGDAVTLELVTHPTYNRLVEIKCGEKNVDVAFFSLPLDRAMELLQAFFAQRTEVDNG